MSSRFRQWGAGSHKIFFESPKRQIKLVLIFVIIYATKRNTNSGTILGTDSKLSFKTTFDNLSGCTDITDMQVQTVYIL